MSKHRHPSRGHRAGRDCQRNSATLLGPGPQARRTLATFLLWKVARPQAEHPPKTKQRFRRCGGEFLSERSERNERIAGGRGCWERPAAYALVFHEPLSPGPLFYGGSQRGAWALASGAVPSGLVSQDYRCRSAQLTKQVLLQGDLRLSGVAYTVGGGRATGRPYLPSAAACTGSWYTLRHMKAVL